MKKMFCRLISLALVLSLSLSLANFTIAYADDDLLVYSMDFAPHYESDEDIKTREDFLEQRWNDFFKRVDELYSKKDYETMYKELGLAACMTLISEYNYTDLKNYIVPELSKLALESVKKADKLLKEKKKINDLDTVHPVRDFLSKAVRLKEYGAYSGEIKTLVEAFINEFIEGKSYYTGKYYTTCYNKEIYAMDIASFVKALYADDEKAFPLTKSTFDVFWDGIMNISYEVDNSPHYDPNTNLGVVLGMAERHNLVDQVKNNENVKRVIYRMAYTVMNNGEVGQWGKSMYRYDAATQKYNVTGAGQGLSLCLNYGYKFYQDPYLLYVSRKLAQYCLIAENEFYNKTAKYNDYIILKPKDINYFDVKMAKPSATEPTTRTTQRLTSRVQYSGNLLGRGDKDLILTQDKMILSTGFHPKSPYMLIDMSHSQSKAQMDHRIGINNHHFNGSYVTAYLGRPAPGKYLNRPIVCPVEYEFPNPQQGEKDYEAKMGYRAALGYTMEEYHANQLSDIATYGAIEYKKFQYDGVHAKREVVLLNNGVAVLKDSVWADENYTGGKNAGLNQIMWGKPIEQGENWRLQMPHIVSEPTGIKDDEKVKTLFYIAPSKDNKKAFLPEDTFATYTVETQYKELKAGEKIVTIQAIIPLPEDKSAAAVGDNISTVGGKDTNYVYTTRIPYSNSEDMVITFYPDKDATFEMKAKEKISNAKIENETMSSYLVYNDETAKKEDIKIKINGKTLKFADQKPIMINDRTLVPLRGIFEVLGAIVNWDEKNQMVTAKKGDISFELKIGNKKGKRNGKDLELDVPAQVINDRTMVPLRFIGEALGAKVNWEDSTSTVYLDIYEEKDIIKVGNYNTVKIPQLTMNVYASSFNDETKYPAKNAIDGKNSTWWYSEKGNYPHILTVELQNPTKICKVGLIMRNDYPGQGIEDYKILVSDDGIKFREVTNGKWNPVNEKGDVKEREAVFDAVTAKYVQIQSFKTKSGHTSIAEVNINRVID